MRIVVLSLAMFGVLLHADSVRAEEPHALTDSAESHYQLAVRLFGEGRYREALDEFDEAIALSPESIFYCNRAIVLLQLREPEAALESLETCQRTHSGGQAELADIDAQRAGVELVVRAVRASARETAGAIATPQPIVAAPQGGWGMTDTGFVFIGIGAAALASAATLDFLSSDLHDDFVASSTATVGGDTSIDDQRASYEAMRQRYVTRQRVWLGLTAVGAVAAVTGVTLVVWSWSRGDDATVRLGVGPSSGYVQVRW